MLIAYDCVATQNMGDQNSKAFWSYIKTLRQDNPSVEDFRIDDDLISNSGLKSEICNNNQLLEYDILVT